MILPDARLGFTDLFNNNMINCSMHNNRDEPEGRNLTDGDIPIYVCRRDSFNHRVGSCNLYITRFIVFNKYVFNNENYITCFQ